MSLQAYLGRIELQTGMLQFTVDQGAAQLLTLTAAEYYPVGYTGADVQLVEHIEDIIQALGGNYATATVALSMTTGKVTIDFDGQTTSITWNDTDLRDALGWTGDLSGSTSYTSPNPCRYVWLPSLEPSRLPVNLTEFWEFTSGTVARQSRDSTSHSRKGDLQYSAGLSYDYLALAEVVIPASGGAGGNGAFESWLKNVAHEGMPVRIVMDRDTYAASTDFKLGLFASQDRESELGAFRDWAAPSLGEDYHGLWDVSMFFVEFSE